MFISLEWLNDYVDLQNKTPEEIMETLTDLGLEVEGMRRADGLPDTLVVGEILAAEKHPNADSLRICKVNVGLPAPLTIVCGAPNARVGLKAPVAQIGTTLPGNFTIKASKIRGQDSEGMMCSQKELQLSDDDHGLWELPNSTAPGQKINSIIRMDDVILEVSLTPNRADCLSYVGIARDLAARFGRSLKAPKKFAPQKTTEPTDAKIKVAIEDPELCGRFTALYAKGLKTVPSPLWIQRRLNAAGMRPINLLVDATNYVLLEYGQPVHAYDMRYLAGNAINVRAARVSDSLTTLDGQELKLRAGDILICDGEKPVGLAGIMGGQNSEIKDDTTAVVIEVAQFNPLQVRKTGKRLGLHTEASHRFERGVDIENTVHAAFRVAEVMALGAAEAGLGSVEIASAAVDVYPRPRMKASIALRIKRLKKILGLATISVDNCVNHLTSLGFVLVDKTDQRMLFEVPSWRHDVTREIDLIEEVARLHGFDKIPYELPSMNIGPTPESPVIAFIDDLRHGMAGLGLSEIITFPFTSHAVAAKLGITGPHPLLPSLRLKNSLNEEMDFMQTTLLSGLLEALLNNRKQGRKGTRLFEIGRGYFDLKNRPVDTKTYPFFANWVRPSYHYSEKAISEANRPRERQLLGGILDFPFQDKSWWQDEAPVSFFHGKDIIVAICKNFGIAPDKLNFARPKAEELPFLHPGAAATIHCEGHTLGWLGELHPGVAMGVDLDPETVPCCFELDIDAVLAATKERQRTVTFASKFPAVTRDIALLVDRKVTHHDFELCFKDFPERAHLRRYDLFDVYAGDKVPQGQHSYAYTLSFQSLEKTLTDKDVDSELTRLLDWTKKKLDATQR